MHIWKTDGDRVVAVDGVSGKTYAIDEVDGKYEVSGSSRLGRATATLQECEAKPLAVLAILDRLSKPFVQPA